MSAFPRLHQMQREGGEMATRTLRIWEKELPKKRGESEVTFRTNIKERGADKTTHHSAITINTANIFNGITQHNFSKRVVILILWCTILIGSM